MATQDSIRNNLQEALTHVLHSYQFLITVGSMTAPPALAPHVSRQVLTLANQALQLADQLEVMIKALPAFYEAPRSDL